MNDTPTQATPAMVGEIDEMESQWRAATPGPWDIESIPDGKYAIWSKPWHNRDGRERGVAIANDAETAASIATAQAALPRLIATARAYHRLREAAAYGADAMETAQQHYTYPELEHFVQVRIRNTAEQLRAALLPPSQHPACDPTDAGSGDVTAEGQNE